MLERSAGLIREAGQVDELGILKGKYLLREERDEVPISMHKELQDKFTAIRGWVGSEGQKFDYPFDEYYPTGYIRELKIPVVPGGEIVAGMDVLESYTLNNFQIYLNYTTEFGSIRYTQYKTHTLETSPTYSLSIVDIDLNDLSRIEYEKVANMSKREFEPVWEMAEYFLERAREVYLPIETTPDKRDY